MIPIDPEDYEQRVAAATNVLDVFAARLVGELDDTHGGFTWWIGPADWKTRALLADYLIQSVYGVQDALLSASFAAKTHRQAVFAENDAFRRAAAEETSPFPLNAQWRRRALTITQSAESCFFHLGQALDRLAAAVIIVGGFEISNVVKADWGWLDEIATDFAKGSARQRYQTPGTDGRAVQQALIAPVQNCEQYGPTDWLQWMRNTRNSLAHRGSAKKFVVPIAPDNRLVRLAYRQPMWSEVQSLVFGARPPRKPFHDALIPTASDDLLESLCESVTALVVAVTNAMDSCCNARAADPQMIVVTAKQWEVVEPTEPMSNFPGYGEPVTITASETGAMNTLDGRRLEAARVMDKRRADWYV